MQKFTTEPDVTVLMTVKNGEPYLHEAVQSILAQTYENFHFLILDNASTDQSREIIKNFNDERIQLIELPNDLGQTGALNYGLELTQTPFVARMDADDVSLPERLARQMAYIDKNSNVALLGTWGQYIDSTNRVIGKAHRPTKQQEIINSFMNYEYNPFIHTAALFLLAPVKQLGGYSVDYHYTQDYSLWLQLSKDYPVANIPIELVQIRQHYAQATRTTALKIIRQQELIDNYQNALHHPKLSLAARKIGKQTLARAKFDYATSLLSMGQQKEGISILKNIFSQFPYVCLKHLCTTKVIDLIRSLTGNQGRKIVYNLRSLRYSS